MKILFLKSILVLCFVLIFTFQAYSQWVAQTSGTTTILRNVKVVNDNIVWACGGNGVVLKTTDGGVNWTTCTTTLATATNYYIDALDANTAWITSTVGGSADVSIWKTTDGGVNWSQQYNNPTGFGDGLRFLNSNEGVYFGDPDPFPSENWEILTTTNGGTNWDRLLQTNFPAADVTNQEFGSATSIDIFGDNVWFSSWYNVTTSNPIHLYKSTNKGYNWTSYPITLPSGQTYSLIAFSSILNGVIVSVNGDVGFTSDGGANWTMSTLSGQILRAVANVPGANMFIAGGNNGVSYYSADFGSWTPITTNTDQTLRSIDATSMNAWAVGDNGTILKLSGDPLPVELTLFTVNVNNNKVALSWETATEVNNYGFEVERASFLTSPIQGWKKIGFVQGSGNSNSPKSYSFTDNNLVGGSKFQYRLKQIDADGKFTYSDSVEVEVIPTEYALYQNYPNPFNPTTTIRYSLPTAGKVLLKVFDILGNEVRTLLDEEKPIGNFEVEFDASNLTNGIYFYRLQVSSTKGGSNNFTSTKKMILLK